MEAVVGIMDRESVATQSGRSGIREYDAKTDAKKRITLRGSRFDYYHVVEFPNGTIELQPRGLRESFEISRNSLRMMDLSMENLQKGIVSEPLDFPSMTLLKV